MADQKQIDKLSKIPAHNRTEEQWEAIYDARTLVNAQTVSNDPDRLAKARLWAGVLLKEERTETEAMEKVANG